MSGLYMIKKYVLFLVATSLFFACQRDELASPLLVQAEQLMQQHPDSALALLDITRHSIRKSSLGNAIWCLLITEAEDKCHIEQPSDSIINIAVNYFQQYRKSKKYMLSLYYKGCVLENLSQKDSAVAYYKKALKVAYYKPSSANLLLIYSRMGALFASMHLQPEALNAYQNVSWYAAQINDSSSIAHAYINIGRIYTLSHDWDHSEDYYQKAIRIAQQTHNYKALKSALFEVCGLYIHTEKFKSASACIQYLDSIKDISTPFDYAKACLTIGNQYRAVNQYDSAIVYLNKASLSDDPYIRQSAYQSFYYLYEGLNKYKEAIPYNNKYWAYADSVQKRNNKKAVIEIVEKYKSEKLLNETTSLQLKNTRIIITGLVSLLLFSILTAVIIIIYQRRLLLRNKTINRIRQQLAELIQKVENNENTIQNNKIIIAQQAALLQQQKNNQEGTTPQKSNLEQINQELEQANRKLKEMIRDKTRMLSAKDEKLIAIQRIADEIKAHPNILVRLKQEGKHLTSDEEWEELLETTDRMYRNFSKRLLLAYPSLTRNDINLCCLIKQGYDAEKMSELLSITEESLTKRKQRLKKRLNRDRKWENGELESLINTF